MKQISTLAALAFVTLTATHAVAADAVKGAAVLKKQQCASCHGEDYRKSAADNIPSLAGQHADYLAQALRQYQAGDSKTNPLARNNATMMPYAKKLSSSDIDNVATYLASLKGDLSVRK
jgi:cytochrome c553